MGVASSWQRVMELVTEEDKETDGPSHIPVVFTDSPIIIHGSSSEEGEESTLVRPHPHTCDLSHTNNPIMGRLLPKCSPSFKCLNFFFF